MEEKLYSIIEVSEELSRRIKKRAIKYSNEVSSENFKKSVKINQELCYV